MTVNRLAGWKHRAKITLDKDKIDETLTWFPVSFNPVDGLVGANDDDVSRIFQEVLGNYLKIAITKDDGQTQLKCEVVSWDHANLTAELWISKDGWQLTNAANPFIYIYYDNDHADNSTYVGVPGSAPAEAVWDSSNVLAHHMDDNPDNQHIMDSTSNDNDGTKVAANRPAEVAGQVGEAQDFEADNPDYITIADSASLDVPGSMTWEAVIKLESQPATNGIMEIIDRWPPFMFQYYDVSGTKYLLIIYRVAPTSVQKRGACTLTAGVSYHVAAVHNIADSSDRLYVNGFEISSSYLTGSFLTPMAAWATDITIGAIGAHTFPFDGIIDEVRVSGAARSAAWLKANYYSLIDQLILSVEFEDFEEEPLGGVIAVQCKQVGYTLTKDVIPSYSRAEGDGNTISEILQDLLDYQEIERVTLGGVDPELDLIMAIEILGGDIWESCKLVRDTVGGYLSVDIDPDDPSVRELWLRVDIGERKGQQIRLNKNLTGIEHETDYIAYCNRLFPIGSGGLLLSTKEYTRQDMIKSSDASYGYLEILGLYSAYKDWTGEGDALPGHITIEKPTGAWASPTGETGNTEWSNPQYAHDANDATYAYYYNWFRRTWTPWLYLTHTGVDATQIKWWNVLAFELSFLLGALTQIDIYYGAAWHNVFNGKYSNTAEWATVSFSQQTITGVRIRVYNSQYYPLPYPQNLSCGIKDIYIWDVTGWADDTSHWVQGAGEKTARCDIGDYDAVAPYVMSYTHADYLIALDDIAARDDIHSDKEEFSTSDIDALISLGTTKLTELKEPIKSIDAGMIDLSTVEGREFEGLELGDIVDVIDEGLDIEEEVRVFRIKKPDLAMPQNIKIEIANKTKDIIDEI